MLFFIFTPIYRGISVHKLIKPKKYNAHPGDGGRRGVVESVRLEDEVDVRPEGDPPARRQREQPVVVQHRVERFHPLGVYVAVAHYPRPHVCVHMLNYFL